MFFEKLKVLFATVTALFNLKAIPKLFTTTAEIIEDVVGTVVLVFIVVVLDVYVIGAQSIFNTTAGAPGYAITSVVVPIFQVALLIIAIIAAVMIIAHGAKGLSGGKK